MWPTHTAIDFSVDINCFLDFDHMNIQMKKYISFAIKSNRVVISFLRTEHSQKRSVRKQGVYSVNMFMKNAIETVHLSHTVEDSDRCFFISFNNAKTDTCTLNLLR